MRKEEGRRRQGPSDNGGRVVADKGHRKDSSFYPNNTEAVGGFEGGSRSMSSALGFIRVPLAVL